VTISLAVSGLVLLLAAAGLGSWLLLRPGGTAGPDCTVPGDPANPAAAPDVDLTAIQLQHASTINAVGLSRGVPERARVIALAAAWQESSLRNRPDGDRDSVGLFQQRPSQGWGTVEQILDPVYASGKFYDALLEVPGWQDMSMTQAAQAVQYSGYPDAYAKWEPQATTLARALGGSVTVELGCREGAEAPTAKAPERMAVTGAEQASAALAGVLSAAQAELGGVTVVDVSDGGGAATVRASLTGLDDDAAARALAAWTVAHGTGMAVTAVVVQDRHWTDHAWDAGPSLPAGEVEITVG